MGKKAAEKVVVAVPPGPLAGFVVEMWPLARVKRYANNPRANEAAIGKVAASIRAFGWQQPIVVDAGDVIVVGDTRYLAAELLKLDAVPVHVARNLTPEQVRAYRIADNRTAEEAEWDDTRLLEELKQLQAAGVDLAVTGFEDAELDELLGTGRGLVPHADPEHIPPLPAEPKSKRGDIFRLGNHVLVCGDARISADWEALCLAAGVTQADLLWTDPPYDVNYQGGTADKLRIQNDALGHEGTVRLLRAALGLALTKLKAGAPMYVCAPHGPQFWAFAKVATELRWWRQTILWIKDSFAFGRSDFHYRHEAIVTGAAPAPDPVDRPFAGEPVDVETIGYGWAEGAKHPWHGGRKRDTGWEVDRPRQNDEHPTAKPVELVEKAVTASAKRGDVLLDPFCGGGSSVIAAEMHGVRVLAIEIDPRYVDVTVARWEQATGRLAIRLARAGDSADSMKSEGPSA